MPKAKKRRKTTKRSGGGNVATREQATRPVATSLAAERPSLFSVSGTRQNVLFSAMLALGFWGFAIYCVFFYTVEANHYLYGAVMALTAVIWSVLTLRRWSSWRRA